MALRVQIKVHTWVGLDYPPLVNPKEVAHE
jgi:hypothetical protein